MHVWTMRTKADIDYHQLGYGSRRVPAVNVKIRDTLSDGYRAFRKLHPDADEGFTMEWIESLGEHYPEGIWDFVVRTGWEELEERAREIYGKSVSVYSEGRQGGWAYIDGINTDVESWDAIEFTQWRSFAKFARETANDIMYRIVDSIYCNEWEFRKQEAHDAWIHEEPNYPEGLRS